MKLGHEVHHLSHLLLELCNVLGIGLLSLKQSLCGTSQCLSGISQCLYRLIIVRIGIPYVVLRRHVRSLIGRSLRTLETATKRVLNIFIVGPLEVGVVLHPGL
ncbi:hypothetical protein RchiOBHm_Chr0c34g0502871 [Rosa chinensis]|uniref:Uncharacterized protein n=1 Tax=Rosa chinensis TaxID=74649 RepID=A0A2P6SQ61_ROSCH|nr:hypothetical protein RchiOBHm_Chr0c34g0502871 [Rosa chinensis]